MTSSCDKTIETHFSCSIGEWMLRDCYDQQMWEVTTQFEQGGHEFIILDLIICPYSISYYFEALKETGKKLFFNQKRACRHENYL